MKQIWLVTQESNLNGEISFNAVPCASKEVARKVMLEEKETLLSESFHYKEHNKEDFIVHESEELFFIQDRYDDYFEEIRIDEKQIMY